ncbi:tetratricopeptide repeat protein [bacterium]|nr:tetratricopeptide repeat protein [bacterium]
MNRLKLIIFGLVIFLLNVGTLRSFDFEQGGIRNFSLGRTGIASSEDLSATVYNPSLLAYRQIEVLTDSRIYLYDLENDDLSFNYFAFSFPLASLGTTAISADVFSANIYQELRAGLHWGSSIFNNMMNLGANLNYYQVGYQNNEFTHNDPLFMNNSNNQSGLDLDIGASFKINDDVRVGLIAKNILGADLALDSANEERLNREYGLGFNLNFSPRVTLMLDSKLIQNSTLEENEYFYAFGSEYLPLDSFALRAGLNNNDITCGFGFRLVEKNYVKSYRNPFNSKRMIESKSLRLSLDYGFSYPVFNDLEIPYGNHFLGLSFQLGSSNSWEEDLKNHVQPRIESSIIELPVRASLERANPQIMIDTVYVERLVRDTVYVIDTLEVMVGVSESDYIKKLEELDVAKTKIETYKTNNQALIHLMNATNFFYNSELEDAAEECRKAIRLAPDMALAYIKLGSIYYRQGKQDLAVRNWRKAKELDPNNPELKAIFKE